MAEGTTTNIILDNNPCWHIPSNNLAALMGIDGWGKYTTIKLYRTIRGPVWKTTSILDLVWKQLGIGDFILNKTSMSSCLTEGWICANGYPWAKQQTTVYEYVCARETAGKGSWLRQKSSMLLMHERLAIKEKGWRGMYSCSDGVACRGEWILYDTRYCMRDSAVLHCWRQGRRQPLRLAQ